MAMSKEYLAYLNQHLEIAPANSQEEVEAAAAIESVLRSQAGLTVEKHDVFAPAEINFVYGVLFLIFFIGVMFAGIGGLFWAFFGIILTALGFAFPACRFIGKDVLARTLPVARSQNIVGHHKGYGPHSGRGVRPIVVIAHYDTGKEELLYKPAISRFAGTIFSIAPVGAAIAAVCTVFQIFGALPEPFLRVVWIVAMVCALPALAWGINNVAAKFMPLSGAANDNNAGVAALLGVVEDVCVSDPAKRAERRASLLEVAAKEAEEARALGLEAYTDVSNTVLPKEEVAENENPAVKMPAQKVYQDGLNPVTGELTDQATGEPANQAGGELRNQVGEAPADQATGEPANQVAGKQTDAAAAVTAEIAFNTEKPNEEKVTADQATVESVSATIEEAAVKAVSTEAAAGTGASALAADFTQDLKEGEGEPDAPTGSPAASTFAKSESVPTTASEEVEFTVVRHGVDVIQKIGMLPRYCEVEYVEEMADAETAGKPVEDTALGETNGVAGQDGEVQNSGDDISVFSGASSAERRARRREAATPQTPLDTIKTFLASLPGPAELITRFSGKRVGEEEGERRRVRRVAKRVASGVEPKAKAEPKAEQDLVYEADAELHREEKAAEKRGADGEKLADAETQYEEEKQGSVNDKEISRALQKAEEGVKKGEVREAPTQEDAEEVPDPTWGTSSFEPITDNKNVARRAALFDLPDPSVATVDPLSDDFQIQPTGEIDPSDFPAEEFDTTGAIGNNTQVAAGKNANSSGLNEPQEAEPQEAADSSQEAISQEKIESLEVLHEESVSFPEDNKRKSRGFWKGGATLSESERANLTDEELAEKQTELEESILDMDYVNLVAHDIWFVATGASNLDHAGAREFFENHKKELRGACVINIDAVGAGELTMLSEEGFGIKKKADRRMLRFLRGISRDIHVPLLQEKRAWADTEATLAMRENFRSVTLMGTDAGQVPALAHSDQNVPENVDPHQVAKANELVSELIRRL